MFTYTEIEHTADAGFIVESDSCEDLFLGAATALFSLVADVDEVGDEIHREIEITGETISELMFDFLREFVFLLSTEGLIFKRFRVLSLDPDSVRMSCRGGRVGNTAPCPELEIKAVTYHDFYVEEHDGRWQARFIVDV
ncbi:MAG: archease [bacterium]|nr:archease [bacterium]